MSRTLAILCAVVIALLTNACVDNVIHVDQSNNAGPWDGTAKNPYKTIQEGLNAASANARDIVEVHGGVYKENVVMKPSTVLRQARNSPTTIVQGNNTGPTITATDWCAIASLTLEGGTSGVLLDLKATTKPQQDILTSVANCRILTTDGIWVRTATNLDFGQGVARKPRIYISDNWIRPGAGASKGGTGLRMELTGPKTGDLIIRADVLKNVIEGKFSGINIEAKGKGGSGTTALFIGAVDNNLIFFCSTGIRLEGEDYGDASLAITNNTIVNNSEDAIISRTGKNAITKPNVANNILANNQGYGYKEFGKNTSAGSLNHNLFYQNSKGHYFDEETFKPVNSQAGLNTPIVNNKVIFYAGKGNIVSNPQFEKGAFAWNGKNWGSEQAGSYFLTQSGTNKSPGIDKGLGSAQDAGLHLLSTSKDFTNDANVVDLGFHYTRPWNE